MRSQKKKVSRCRRHFFLRFFVDLQKKKKKVLRLISASFLCALRGIPERGAVNRSCLPFLVGNKNADFWQEKTPRNSQNFSAKMLEKILHFFALIGNTERE